MATTETIENNNIATGAIADGTQALQHDAYDVNRRILEEIMSTAEWRQLREAGSINDPMISAIATIGACERAIDALDPNSRKQVNRLAAANEAAEKLFKQANILDELASQATAQQVDDLCKRADKARAAARRQELASEKIEEALDKGDDEQGRAVRQAARQGMAEALDEA